MLCGSPTESLSPVLFSLFLALVFLLRRYFTSISIKSHPVLPPSCFSLSIHFEPFFNFHWFCSSFWKYVCCSHTCRHQSLPVGQREGRAHSEIQLDSFHCNPVFLHVSCLSVWFILSAVVVFITTKLEWKCALNIVNILLHFSESRSLQNRD